MHRPLDFSHERDVKVEDLVRRVQAYYPDADFVMLRKAFHFADRAHKGQKRSSGESYITHPLNVASTLIKLRMDLDSIIAGLLHDTIEDCDVTPEDIEKEFSESISQVVVGLTKISKIKFKTKEESQAENFRKMVVAMAKDLRVIIVKLADRMHNMRTLQYVSDEKQKKIALTQQQQQQRQHADARFPSPSLFLLTHIRQHISSCGPSFHIISLYICL